MDLSGLFDSINKLSLIAFIAVFGVLAFEIYHFRKENSKKTKPAVPSFTGDTSLKINNATLIHEKTQHIEKKSMAIFVILGILLLVFGILTIVGFGKVSSSSATPDIQAPAVTYTASKGIKIFNDDFKLISDTDASHLTPGDQIIIGVESVPSTDIDRARIRVNRSKWDITDITSQYSKENNVYFISYFVATGESQLSVEAQLHSAADGWLGE